MNKLFRYLFLFAIVAIASAFAFGDDPATMPSPVPGPGGWVSSQGGWMAAILAVVVSFNIAFTALHEICLKLKLKEPGWLQSAGSWGAKILGYLTANTTNPPIDPSKKV